MNSNSSYKHLILITFTFLFVILFLQLYIGWYQNFSDAIHYLWIADKYAEGDFGNAINTYWGPMISWLLLFLKPLIHDPFVRFRILQIILGIVACYFIHRILKKEIGAKYSLLFTLTATPIIASFAWFYLTPDLLLLCGMLLLIDYRKHCKEPTLKNILVLAIIGAVLYFIKSIGLYFFILIITGTFFTDKEFRTRINLFKHILLAFFLILFCSPWIYLISLKNGSFTIGTSGGHNYKMNSPKITPDIYGEVGNPYHLGTLTEPIPANAFDACVEHAHQSYSSWEGMTGSEIFSYYLKIIFKNIKSARSMFFGLDIGSVFLVLLLAASIIHRKRILEFLLRNNIYIWILVANIVLYLPFFFMDRYTWPGLMALFFLSVLLIFYFSRPAKSIAIYSLMFVVLVLNFFSLYREIEYAMPEKPITEAIWSTKSRVEINRSIWICSKSDKRLGLVKGFIYYNRNGQYLGALFSEKNSAAQIADELKKFNINTIITFDGIPDSLLNNNSYTTIPTFKSEHLFSFQIQIKDQK